MEEVWEQRSKTGTLQKLLAGSVRQLRNPWLKTMPGEVLACLWGGCREKRDSSWQVPLVPRASDKQGTLAQPPLRQGLAEGSSCTHGHSGHKRKKDAEAKFQGMWLITGALVWSEEQELQSRERAAPVSSQKGAKDRCAITLNKL